MRAARTWYPLVIRELPREHRRDPRSARKPRFSGENTKSSGIAPRRSRRKTFRCEVRDRRLVAPEAPQERSVEIGLRMLGREPEELDVIGVLELVDRRRMNLSQRW